MLHEQHSHSQADSFTALEMVKVKKSYEEAFKTSPRLIETESNPLHFLRTDDYNPWQAAKRLAMHWWVEYRLFFFLV